VEIRVVRVEYDGSPALLFHVRDITERRAAEQALRSSETLFRSVWENSVDGMRLTDENGTIVAVNEAFCRMVGMSHAQLESQPGRVGLLLLQGRHAHPQLHLGQLRHDGAFVEREKSELGKGHSAAVGEIASSV